MGWRVPEICLFEAELRVQPAGHKRALKSKVRNVHAYACGTVRDIPQDAEWVKATYQPFSWCGSFELLTGEPIAHCEWVWLNSEGLFVVL